MAVPQPSARKRKRPSQADGEGGLRYVLKPKNRPNLYPRGLENSLNLWGRDLAVPQPVDRER